jgi:hypothetical protein
LISFSRPENLKVKIKKGKRTFVSNGKAISQTKWEEEKDKTKI